MKLRRAAAVALGGLGATAALNRLLADSAGDLPPGLPGRQRTYRWRGFDVAYTEAGDEDDPDVVLLHGIHAAASSREFATVVDRLAERYHVLAPDLPGFGRTDRPDVTYTAALYQSFVESFLADLVDRPTVVATSLTGAYAAEAAREIEVERLFLVCPTADTGPTRPWFRSLLRTPVVGTGLFNLLVSRPGLRWFDRNDAYYWPEDVDPETLNYQWRTAHQHNARLAPASFLGGVLDPENDLGTTLALLDVPVTLVWGREATITSLEYGRLLAEDADARLVVFDEARLLPHAEYPDQFVDLLRREERPDAESVGSAETAGSAESGSSIEGE